MRTETLTVHCDTYGCRQTITGESKDDLRAEGWFLTTTSDLCPHHAPAEYECSRCGGTFVTLSSFDAHLTDCKKGPRHGPGS